MPRAVLRPHLLALILLLSGLAATSTAAPDVSSTDAVVDVVSNGGPASVTFSNLADPSAGASPAFAVTLGGEEQAALEVVGPEGNARIRIPHTTSEAAVEVHGDVAVHGNVHTEELDRLYHALVPVHRPMMDMLAGHMNVQGIVIPHCFRRNPAKLVCHRSYSVGSAASFDFHTINLFEMRKITDQRETIGVDVEMHHAGVECTGFTRRLYTWAQSQDTATVDDVHTFERGAAHRCADLTLQDVTTSGDQRRQMVTLTVFKYETVSVQVTVAMRLDRVYWAGDGISDTDASLELFDWGPNYPHWSSVFQ